MRKSGTDIYVLFVVRPMLVRALVLTLLPTEGGEGWILIPDHQTISCHSEAPLGMTPKLCDFSFLPFCHIMKKS